MDLETTYQRRHFRGHVYKSREELDLAIAYAWLAGKTNDPLARFPGEHDAEEFYLTVEDQVDMARDCLHTWWPEHDGEDGWWVARLESLILKMREIVGLAIGAGHIEMPFPVYADHIADVPRDQLPRGLGDDDTICVFKTGRVATTYGGVIRDDGDGAEEQWEDALYLLRKRPEQVCAIWYHGRFIR